LFDCSRCDREYALRRTLCEYCFLSDRIEEIATGSVDLRALVDVLLAVDRPDSLIVWLRLDAPRALLSLISDGEIPITHDGLDSAPNRASADHLRAVLVQAQMLPSRDPLLARYDRWLEERLPKACGHDDDLNIIRQYVAWHQRRKLEQKSTVSPLRAAQLNTATQTLRVAGQFLAWLRESDTALDACKQEQVDEWFATPPTTRTLVRPFLVWAKSSQHMPDHAIGYRTAKATTHLNQEQRFAAIAKCLAPEKGDVSVRCAALLVLLFAQPIQRLVALKLEAISEIDGELRIELGGEAVPVPSPFDAPFRELRDNRNNIHLYNRHSAYLFPGYKPGTHLAPSSCQRSLVKITGKVLAARNTALRELVVDCPPPVVADMLGYTNQVTTKHAAKAGSPWMAYAATRRNISESRRALW